MLVDEDIFILATDEILDIASPRKPFVVKEKRSLDFEIFEVVCFKKHSFISFSFIPLPLSLTSINVLPKSFINNFISVDSASTEFSISSLITEDGLCITSPAAILLIKSNDNLLIVDFICKILINQNQLYKEKLNTEL